MAQVKKGDTVRIDFDGKLEDGTVIDSTRTSDCCDDDCGCDSEQDGEGCDSEECGCDGEVGPMELTVGEGDFFELVEAALIGMKPGEKKTVVIPAAEAFGDYDEELVFTVERSELPADLQPEVGAEIVLTDENDECIEVTVVDADEKSLTFDSNHPLAGHDLTYEVELLEILPA